MSVSSVASGETSGGTGSGNAVVENIEALAAIRKLIRKMAQVQAHAFLY
jgi:hypothetical protein